MIPILFNLPTQPSSLMTGYADYRLEIAESLGYGTNENYWTTDQVGTIERSIQKAYRWCLYPQSIPGERIPHVWTWLEQTTTLATVADDYDYTLPANFGSFVGNYFTWPSGSAYDPPYRVNDTDILMQRGQSTQTDRPQKFALRWLAQTAGTNQQQEVIFWPTPDAAYTLTYKYAILVNKLQTTNPYPLGGPRMSEMMLQACRALGEFTKTGARGDQWAVFMEALHSAIMLDKGTNTTPTVGVMGPNRSFGTWDNIGTTEYYSGPFNNDPENGSPLYTLVTS